MTNQPYACTPDFGICAACGKPLGATHYAFAFQNHLIAFSRPGETLNDQAELAPGALSIKASFCSNQCCKPRLGELLEAYGLPAAFQHNQIDAGPVHACGHCGRPVVMTEPHGAWVRCKLTMARQGEVWVPAVDWLDVLAVTCGPCGSIAGETEEFEQVKYDQVIRHIPEINPL